MYDDKTYHMQKEFTRIAYEEGMRVTITLADTEIIMRNMERDDKNSRHAVIDYYSPNIVEGTSRFLNRTFNPFAW